MQGREWHQQLGKTGPDVQGMKSTLFLAPPQLLLHTVQRVSRGAGKTGAVLLHAWVM